MWGPSSTRIEALLFLACASSAACDKRATPSEPLKVAAAADLSFAFKDVGAAYEKKTGEKVVFSFGATGLLEKQLAEGAPFDVFAAANVSYADDAVRRGPAGRLQGPLRHRAPRSLFDQGGGLPPADDGRSRRPPRGQDRHRQPRHAPYGKAAKQAMERAGVWDKVQSKVVYGENVQQTLQFAQSGNADVAIVALSLATVTPGESAPIPTELHDPIDQALVACTHGKAGTQEARKFIAFVQSAEGHAVMRKYGFLLPGESMPEAKTDTKP